MEENSEAQMETDVSTPTVKVSNVQEVSLENMQTVVFVEKMTEEKYKPEADSKEVATGSPEKQVHDKTPVKEPILVKSPPKKDIVIMLNKSPEKDISLTTESTQNKDLEISPSNDPQVLRTYTRTPQKDKSSGKLEPTKDALQLEESAKTSDEDIVMEDNVSPPKEISTPEEISKEVSKSPTKDTTDNNTEKILSNTPELSNSTSLDIQVLSNSTLTDTQVSSISMSEDKTDKSVENEEDQTQERRETKINNNDDIAAEKTCDSSHDTTSETSESHNKSISRELKSLIKSAKESKIISECTQLTSKTRKSRTALDTSLSIGDAEKINGSRRGSDNSQMSNCSEKSDKTTLKRSMRSQNPEFVNKVKLFLNSVTGKTAKIDAETLSDEDEEKKVHKESHNDSPGISPKKKKMNEPEVSPARSNRVRSDPYCWRCHWSVEASEKQHLPLQCTVCPRSFHFKCLSGTERTKISENNFVCPECLTVLHAESSDTRSPAMKKISLSLLSDLLNHALQRMMDLNGAEPFLQPVDRSVFPDYEKYVVHPMDLNLMQKNISEGLYGSTEAFLADAQWILHNSIIFNSLQSKLTGAARALVRSCRAEVGEIEACPECYAAAHARRPTWFTDVCSTPHLLLWAKLKGFPYWPAKCMSISNAGLVDVRFFGAHDRAWVPAKDCYLYSETDPNPHKTKRHDILDSMQEAEQHLSNISRKYGNFKYAPFKTLLDPNNVTEQLKIMIPNFEGEIKRSFKSKTPSKPAQNKSRSNSKSSKTSNEGDTSECEDTGGSQPRKMADGAEIPMEEDYAIEKDKTMENNETTKDDSFISVDNETDFSRKRRRSQMEEAVFTIIHNSGDEKRKRFEDENSTEDEIVVDDNNKSQDVVYNNNDVDMDLSENQSNKPEERNNETTSATKQTNGKSLVATPLKERSKRPPIKIVLKAKRTFRAIPQREKDNSEKIITPYKIRPPRSVKLSSTEKEKLEATFKSYKSRNSRTSSLNNSPISKSDKSVINKNDNSLGDKNKASATGKVDEKSNEELLKERNVTKPKDAEQAKSNGAVKSKEAEVTSDTNNTKANESIKSKDNLNKTKELERQRDSSSPKAKDNQRSRVVNAKSKENEAISKSSSKSSRDRIQFDDDTSLAVIARETTKINSTVGLPTISSVRSLCVTAQTSEASNTPNSKIVETTADARIFIPTSTDNVRNMKEAVSKLQKLRGDTDQSLVGKVGVRAFARMTSTPEKQPAKVNEVVQSEIKLEPLELDEVDRQVEKLDMMKAFRLQPVTTLTTTTTSNLREVRINKATTIPANARKAAKPDAKIRARKTFPQPKKTDEGRSELNCKNSMVYIPIQPPTTQAPVRMTRAITVNGTAVTTPVSRSVASVITTNTINAVKTTPTQVPQIMPLVPSSISTSTSTTVAVVSMASNNCGQVQNMPAIGQIPTTVHTVPLITSVNGQWTFSLQPIMSVGGIDGLDNNPSPPLLNGMSERVSSGPTILPLPAGSVVPQAPLVPAIGPTTVIPNVAATTVIPNVGLTGVASSGMPCSVGGTVPVGGPTPVAGPVPAVAAAPAAVPTAPAPPPPVLQAASTSVGNSSSRTPDNTVGEPPRLQHKPLVNPFDISAPIGEVPPPSMAGPLTAKLNQNAIKLTDFFRTLLEDTLEKIEEPVAQVTGLKLQLEEARWRHQQEVDELKHNHELIIAEMRASFEKDRARVVSETRRAAQLDLEAAVKLAKSKQWCVNCSQEAQFYCCWNTSYCDYACQRAHWAQHYAVCVQNRNEDQEATNTDNDKNSKNNRVPPTDNLPKTTAAPAINKVTVPAHRIFEQQNIQKSSIIVSMLEDSSGNQTVKCVGTYKPPGTSTQMSPIILNKQVNIINSEDTTKKVVTSGGYLIVGANANSPLVTPPRRPQTIQYYS